MEGTGKVILQTMNPNHVVLAMLIKHEVAQFYENETNNRKKSFYPPFCRLIFIEMRNKDKEKLLKQAQYFSQLIKPTFGDFLLGPEFALIPRVKNEFRMNILLKIDRNKSILAAKTAVHQAVRSFFEQEDHKKTRIIVDVDPV